MKLVPLGDKVILKQKDAEVTTKSGIVIAGAEKEKPQEAEVIAVGPGGMVDGKEVTMMVKPGDVVIYSKYAGTEVKLEDEEFIVVRQNDIVAIVEKSGSVRSRQYETEKSGGMKSHGKRSEIWRRSQSRSGSRRK